MSERYGIAIGALIVAVLFLVGGILIGQHISGPYKPRGGNVNPIGFHADGIVQIKEKNTLDVKNCSPKADCTLEFTFVTDQLENVVVPLTCNGYTKCIVFLGTMMIPDSPDGIENHKVSGRVALLPKTQRLRFPHVSGSGVGFYARGLFEFGSNSLDLGSCTNGTSCHLTFDLSTKSDVNYDQNPVCPPNTNCMAFDTSMATVADGPGGITDSGPLSGYFTRITTQSP